MDEAADEYRIAQFPREAGPSSSDGSLLEQAGEAVHRELEDSTRWKRLRCHEVIRHSESEAGVIYELRVGQAVEFDWTWEGAQALRPTHLREFESSVASASDEDAGGEIGGDSVWLADVLEVEESAGRIFVLDSLNSPPCRGAFYVRPYEFLASLDNVYQAPKFEDIRPQLPSRLKATEGGVHPEVNAPAGVGLEPLRPWWRHSWSVLWGPPGTGKTYTLGRQVASVLADPTERVLVVSTTNKATDGAALSIGRAALEGDRPTDPGFIRRIGKTAHLPEFRDAGLEVLLEGTETELLVELSEATKELNRTRDLARRAELRSQIKEIRLRMADASLGQFLDAGVRVVVATSLKAVMLLNTDDVVDLLNRGTTPFTTILIDEAGLVSRAASAVLALLAARRVVLVGDSKQLAPISRISRVIEPQQGRWLGKSGLSHLDRIGDCPAGVHALREQHRMHPDICGVVSAYHYDGKLTTAPAVLERSNPLPERLAEAPRAVWCVLDETIEDLPSIRASRGPGNRSWVREATLEVLARLFGDGDLDDVHGLFISPYRAQAKRVGDEIARRRMPGWSASTVHSQQGAEADMVIFDTVNAGSYGWPHEEWKRLVNVGLSRARESLVVIASRAEMQEPFLSGLRSRLVPCVLRQTGGRWRWAGIEPPESLESGAVEPTNDPRLGGQLVRRRSLRPVMSEDQQRLCGLSLDGKPRLVRGVAGSGKTAVLANWLAQTLNRLEGQPDARVWAVFANRTLQALLVQSIDEAWREIHPSTTLPWERVEVLHIQEVLEGVLPTAGLKAADFGFDYDGAAERFLTRVDPQTLTPRCHALFIDEAQDMGPSVLRLLSHLVEQSDPSDPNSRSVNIFFDNAQNIYGRGVPTWSRMGLDLRGRSTVLKESFRSTQPITELALNVLYRLCPPDGEPEHTELQRLGLIEPSKRDGEPWWSVRFTQIDGSRPEFHRFASLEEEFVAVGDYCRELIGAQAVRPRDIVILYNGKNIPGRLTEHTAPRLEGLGVDLAVDVRQPHQRGERVLLATTSHAFKGFDAEVVLVVGVDQFQAKDCGVLAQNLYVAMTRARSLLAVFGRDRENDAARQIVGAVGRCVELQRATPPVTAGSSSNDDFEGVLDVIGERHRPWLEGVWRGNRIKQEPLVDGEGRVVADPLFTFRRGQRRFACFGASAPDSPTSEILKKHRIVVLQPGDPYL